MVVDGKPRGRRGETGTASRDVTGSVACCRGACRSVRTTADAAENNALLVSYRIVSRRSECVRGSGSQAAEVISVHCKKSPAFGCRLSRNGAGCYTSPDSGAQYCDERVCLSI